MSPHHSHCPRQRLKEKSKLLKEELIHGEKEKYNIFVRCRNIHTKTPNARQRGSDRPSSWPLRRSWLNSLLHRLLEAKVCTFSTGRRKSKRTVSEVMRLSWLEGGRWSRFRRRGHERGSSSAICLLQRGNERCPTFSGSSIGRRR